MDAHHRPYVERPDSVVIFVVVGALTHVANKEFVELITNAPRGVLLRNAEGLLPMHSARLYITHGFTIQDIADLVRLLAVGKYTGSDSAKAGHLLAPVTETSYTTVNLDVRTIRLSIT